MITATRFNAATQSRGPRRRPQGGDPGERVRPLTEYPGTGAYQESERPQGERPNREHRQAGPEAAPTTRARVTRDPRPVRPETAHRPGRASGPVGAVPETPLREGGA